ncbi:hypothetical protein L6452_24943 [Arctium lappa]|uniref:Uncharacterized protein n=1 Tax=Arctium lappa TaxID=4217 RepID=A0ACB9A9U2_ARCLA|nr:hypothetical protein L6452_24943 [Arctium lappa]
MRVHIQISLSGRVKVVRSPLLEFNFQSQIIKFHNFVVKNLKNLGLGFLLASTKFLQKPIHQWIDIEEEEIDMETVLMILTLTDTLEVEVHHLHDLQTMLRSIVTVEVSPEIAVLLTAVHLVILSVAVAAVEVFARWMATVVSGL